MTGNLREILEQVERGEMDSRKAVQMMSNQSEPEQALGKADYLTIRVDRLHDHQPRVFVRIPLRWIELGLSIGARYAPELEDLDFKQLLEGLHKSGEGSIVEVEDIEDDQHVIISIERG